MREPPLRAEVLAEISQGDSDFERELLARFLSCTDADASQLDMAMGDRAVERIHALAHLVQGRCKSLGAMTLAQAGERLERAASLGDWCQIAEAYERVREELAALRREIDRHLS